MLEIGDRLSHSVVYFSIVEDENLSFMEKFLAIRR